MHWLRTCTVLVDRHLPFNYQFFNFLWRWRTSFSYFRLRRPTPTLFWRRRWIFRPYCSFPWLTITLIINPWFFCLLSFLISLLWITSIDYSLLFVSTIFLIPVAFWPSSFPFAAFASLFVFRLRLINTLIAIFSFWSLSFLYWQL